MEYSSQNLLLFINLSDASDKFIKEDIMLEKINNKMINEIIELVNQVRANIVQEILKELSR